MQNSSELPPGEMLRRAMRQWVTGVAIVTSQAGGIRHGMTVNSFGSISLEPPLVTVTMNHNTRTCALVEQSGIFAVTILSNTQQALAELFAGRLGDEHDRMEGVETFKMETGAPLLSGGLAFVDCKVVYQYPMLLSTLFIGEVIAARVDDQDGSPLVYHNRVFLRLP